MILNDYIKWKTGLKWRCVANLNSAVIAIINRQKSNTMNTFWKTGWKSLSLITAVFVCR